MGATVQSSSAAGARQSRPPARVPLEYRLRRGGLFCAIDGYSTWQRFAVNLARDARRLPIVVVPIVYFCVSAAWATWNDGVAFKFFNFVPFDALAPVVLVFSIVVGRVVYNRTRHLSALITWWLGGLSLALLLGFMPYLAFTRARLDARLASVAGAPHSVVHAGEAGLLAHFALMGVIGALIVLELKTTILTTTFGLLTGALRAAPSTVVDVLQTLPLVLTVLFFVAFTHDTWETFGSLGPPQLVLLVLLLFGCVVCVVIRASREEVRKLGQRAVMQPTAMEKDDAVRELRDAGVPVESLAVNGKVAKALKRQWIFQISLCVLVAGIIVTSVIWIATGLATSRPEVRSWLENKSPTKVLDATVWKVHVFLTWQGLVVAIVLGAFASLVFAGVAISQNDPRTQLFEGERDRLRRLLLVAGTYKNAVRREIWRGRPGMKWSNYSAFIADDPERWHTEPDEFGNQWREEASGRRWRAAWNETTGELYIYRSKTSTVELLAICKERLRLEAALGGWKDYQRQHDSLNWLRREAEKLDSGSEGHDEGQSAANAESRTSTQRST